jgi:CRISPR/Cas system type I-B associated protein Csh2 (Cas7 group RAMP superfamily)
MSDLSERAEAMRIITDLGPEKTADLLSLLGSVVIQTSDGLEDEGDRVYLGTTNHKEMLRDACQQWFEVRYLSADRPTPKQSEAADG